MYLIVVSDIFLRRRSPPPPLHRLRNSISSVESLRRRKAELMSQVAAVDARLESHRDFHKTPGFPQSRQASWPSGEAVAGGAAPPGGGAMEGVAGGGLGGGHWNEVKSGSENAGENMGVGGRLEGKGEGAAGLGVGVNGHFILGLSTEEFGSTPVDQASHTEGETETESWDRKYTRVRLPKLKPEAPS